MSGYLFGVFLAFISTFVLASIIKDRMLRAKGIEGDEFNLELIEGNIEKLEEYAGARRGAEIYSTAIALVACYVAVYSLGFYFDVGGSFLLLFLITFIVVIAMFIRLNVVFKSKNEIRWDIEAKENSKKGLLKRGVDGSVIKKTQSAITVKAELLAELNKSKKDGTLVGLSVKVLQTESETNKEREYQAKKPEQVAAFNRLGWRAGAEDRSIVIGVPGSGKTAYLVAQIVDWMTSGRSFVATDIKPEVWSILKENGLFEKFGYSDYVINPTCKEAHKFNMFSEIENDSDLNEVLSVIITAGTGDTAVFNDNARRLLKAILLHLGDKASLPAARDFIFECGSTDELIDILCHSQSKSVARIAREVKATAGNERLFASIMTTMNQAFEFLDDEIISESISSSDFSMRKVLSEKRNAVFLQFEQKYKSSVATLFGATVSYVLRELQNSAPVRKSEVFIALDEIINAAPIPKFSDFLNTIRSAKMPLCMYLQSIEGLNRLYGLGSDKVFIGSTDLKVIFRVNDNDTAKFVSEQAGETAVVTRNKSESYDVKDRGSAILTAMHAADTSASWTTTSSRTALVDPYDVLALPAGEAIVIYKGKVGQLDMPAYYKDFPMPNRAAENARPVKAIEVTAEA